MIDLRPITVDDKDQILRWRNLPEVAQYMYTDHEISQTEHDHWFNKVLADATSRYWIIVCDGEDVGLANISNIDFKNSRCYWAFYVASPNVRGKGVGSFVEHFVLSFVFEQLKLNKLCCEVLGFNEGVVAMHQNFGFIQEGLFRSHIIKNSIPHDIVCLAMLNSEWQANKEAIRKRLVDKGIIQ